MGGGRGGGAALRCAEERRTTGARHAASSAIRSRRPHDCRRRISSLEQSVIKACMHIQFPDRTSWSKTKNTKSKRRKSPPRYKFDCPNKNGRCPLQSSRFLYISACGAVKSRCMDPVPRRPPREQERQDKIACNHMSSPAPRCCAEDASLFKDRHSEKRRSGHV